MALTTARQMTEDRDADAVEVLKRDFLPQWAEWSRNARVGKGVPSRSPFVDLMRPLVPDNFDADDRPNPVAARAIEDSVIELSGQPGMTCARSALAVRYIGAGLPAVFRSGRLQHLTLNEVEDLADEAERRLVPLARRRGIPI